MNLKQQSNLEGKNDVFFPQPHTFNVSKKLTSDSMMIYSINGKKVFEKVNMENQFRKPEQQSTVRPLLLV